MIKRYGVRGCSDDGEHGVSIFLSDNGEFVKYADHIAAPKAMDKIRDTDYSLSEYIKKEKRKNLKLFIIGICVLVVLFFVINIFVINIGVK